MQAIILAAGMGKRLKHLTKDNTKCMVKVNGVSLIERMLNQLDIRHLSRIIIVVGYKSEELIDYISGLNIKTPIIYIRNNIYDKTNNIYSLSLARDWLLKEDTLLFESDIIFEDSLLDDLINDERDTLALADKYESWMDGTCLKLDDNDNIIAVISKKQFDFNDVKDYYKTVNIYKFGKHFSETYYIPFLDAYQTALGRNEYYEQVLRVIAMLDESVVKAKRLSSQKWYEIDDVQDLNIAESIFTNETDKAVHMTERYGGYWRYPKLLDFCYLVNPYYPPKRMRDEIKSSFDVLVEQYPSGMTVNSLLASRNFGVLPENIVVGNGASELIRSILCLLDGVTCFIRPSFNEYANRFDEARSVFFDIKDSINYDINDLCSFLDNNAEKNIRNIVLVNPDNPTGNYIKKSDILSFARKTAGKNIRLILDESFVDFADEENATLIDMDTISQFRELYIIKSISKSYGVPGLRLGVLVSGNTDIIDLIKKDVSIWNINSFAEFFMQIEEKYRNDYMLAINRFKKTRSRFYDELSHIPGIEVLPSQANYFMVRLTGGMSAKSLSEALLTRYNILVKDLSRKFGSDTYLRIAIRSDEENDRLISAVREIMDTTEVVITN